MRPKVPRGTNAPTALPLANSNVSGDKSFADNLNKEQGIVSCRVALLLRCSKICTNTYTFFFFAQVQKAPPIKSAMVYVAEKEEDFCACFDFFWKSKRLLLSTAGS